MGWANAISTEHDAAIKSAILTGRSTGNIALEFGVHRNSVVLRRKDLKAKAANCSCGRAASHKGTCQPRLLLAAQIVQPLVFRRTRSWKTSIQYSATPVEFRNQSLSPEQVLVAVDSVIPRSLPRQVRDEVRSEMLLAHVEGNLPINELGAMCRDYVAKVYGMFPDKGAPLSLDAIDEHTGRSLYERLDEAMT